MADNNNASKTKNQAFLEHMERQRLSKPSNRTIDLRTKVAGECQAYSFGGMTHYLDDRGYLLAKQLMARFNGGYTVGVYEALVKTIKSLSPTTNLPTIKVNQTILSRDESQVQLIALDQQFERKESRITHSSPVEVRAGDMLYNGSTIDIATAAIRVVLKRVFTLELGDIIAISLPELTPLSEPELLTNLPYKIVKIDHDNRRSHIILARDTTDNDTVTRWFEKWVNHHQTLQHFDVDHQLLNIASRFYLRLYHQTLTKPLLWLSNSNDTALIQACHLGSGAEKVMDPLANLTGETDTSLLPIQQLLATDVTDYLVVIYKQANVTKSYIVPCDQPEQISLALAWHNQHRSHILLMQSHHIEIASQFFEQEIAQLADISHDSAQKLSDRLASISTLMTLTDITNSCQQLPIDKTLDFSPLISLKNAKPLSTALPRPSALHHHIDRKNQRFLIKTKVSIQLVDQSFTVTTDDVSETGLSLSLAGRIPAPEGSVVRVNFIRWQSQTKRVKLDAIPFIIKRIQYWEGVTTLGLERNILACGEKVNSFFSSTIEQNKNQLALDNRDAFISHESRVLGSQLNQNLTSTPFFLAVDRSNKRILQAIATTAANQAKSSPSLWKSLQSHATAMYELLKLSTDEEDTTASFGLYCYLDTDDNWQISTEHDFETTIQKSLFFHRALRSKQYHFYHCTLSAIKAAATDQETDLHQQLSMLRQYSPNNVRQIKDVVYSLFAVGELTDITEIIKAAY